MVQVTPVSSQKLLWGIGKFHSGMGLNVETPTGEELQSLMLRLLKCKTSIEADALLREIDVDAEMSFEDVDWQQLREQDSRGSLKFPYINWAERKLIFSGCDFGDGDITLAGVFKGPVNFDGAHFGQGDVSFVGSEFSFLRMRGVRFSGRGKVMFGASYFAEETVFQIEDLGQKLLWFTKTINPTRTGSYGCTFSGRKVLLAIIGSSGTEINFSQARFDVQSAILDFSGATRLARVDFSETKWESHTVTLHGLQTRFDSGQPGQSNRLLFNGASFEKVKMLKFDDLGMKQGLMDFTFARFPTTGVFKVVFSDVGPGQINFHQAVFPGNVEFSQNDSARFFAELSFFGTTFQGALLFRGVKFGPVPDLRGTEFQKHLSLSEIEFGAHMSRKDKRNEIERASKLNRFKELAEANRDHSFALDCHAEEMQHRRFQKPGWKAKAADYLDMAYQVTSDYGRSIMLPVCWLSIVWSVFKLVYWYGFDSIESAGLFSAAWTFPFLPASGALRLSNFAEVFAQGAPSLFILMGLQGLLSIALFFLIGLGFRNRFRI